jgi:hypothetical protein
MTEVGRTRNAIMVRDTEHAAAGIDRPRPRVVTAE